MVYIVHSTHKLSQGKSGGTPAKHTAIQSTHAKHEGTKRKSVTFCFCQQHDSLHMQLIALVQYMHTGLLQLCVKNYSTYKIEKHLLFSSLMWSLLMQAYPNAHSNALLHPIVQCGFCFDSI